MPLPQRKSPRLEGFDYRQARAYFVTICTHHKEHIFGEIIDGEMIYSKQGQIAHHDIALIGSRWHHADVDYFVVMPNHVHIIVTIADSEDTFTSSASNVGAGFFPPVTTEGRQKAARYIRQDCREL